MFSVWLVFTSNLNSQTSWLKVKFKLANLWTIFLAGEDHWQVQKNWPNNHAGG